MDAYLTDSSNSLDHRYLSIRKKPFAEKQFEAVHTKIQIYFGKNDERLQNITKLCSTGFEILENL